MSFVITELILEPKNYTRITNEADEPKLVSLTLKNSPSVLLFSVLCMYVHCR